MNPLKQLPQLPGFAAGVILGVVQAVLTEAETFLLAVASVFVGLWLGASVGLATFFLLFILLRFAGQFIGALTREFHFIGAVLRDREFEITLKEDPPEPIDLRDLVPSIFPPVPPTKQDPPSE